MKTAIFFNFTAKPFTGYWNGKAKTFKPGAKVPMPEYLAAHYAKHLTNAVLIEKGMDNYTSPKFPAQVPQFLELFNKACLVESDAEDLDETEMETDLAGRRSGEPSMSVPDQDDRPVKGPGREPQIVSSPDDEDDFEDTNIKGNGKGDVEPRTSLTH